MPCRPSSRCLKPLDDSGDEGANAPSGLRAIEAAHQDALIQSAPDGFINASQYFAYQEGALYELHTAPGFITTIALQPGERLVRDQGASHLPPGLYVRTSEPPAVGLIAAFPMPETAKRYKAEIGETVHDDFLFMKPIVAGQGDLICMKIPNGLYLNGAGIAQVVTKDGAGRSLPLCHGSTGRTLHPVDPWQGKLRQPLLRPD